MTQEIGASASAETGPRASTEPCSTVSALSVLDPASSEWQTPELAEAERKILIAMYDGVDPDFGFFPFKAIASRSGVEMGLVKSLVRLLAQTGEAQFMRGLWDEDGQMVGSGYGLTERGRERAHHYYGAQIDRELAALAAATGTAKTPQAVEREASQSGPAKQGNAPKGAA